MQVIANKYLYMTHFDQITRSLRREVAEETVGSDVGGHLRSFSASGHPSLHQIDDNGAAAITIVGPNGAGKSSLTNSVLEYSGVRKHRADPHWFDGLARDDNTQDLAPVLEEGEEQEGKQLKEDIPECIVERVAVSKRRVSGYLLPEASEKHTTRRPTRICFGEVPYFRVHYHAVKTVVMMIEAASGCHMYRKEGVDPEVKCKLGKVETRHITGKTYAEVIDKLRELAFNETICQRDRDGNYQQGNPFLWVVKSFEVGLPLEDLKSVSYTDSKGSELTHSGLYSSPWEALCNYNGLIIVLGQDRASEKHYVETNIGKPGFLNKMATALKRFASKLSQEGMDISGLQLRLEENSDEEMEEGEGGLEEEEEDIADDDGLDLRPRMLVVVMAEKAYCSLVKQLQEAVRKVHDLLGSDHTKPQEHEDEERKDENPWAEVEDIEGEIAVLFDETKNSFQQSLIGQLKSKAPQVPREVVKLFVEEVFPVYVLQPSGVRNSRLAY